MDLKDLKPESRDVEIRHPATGEDLGVRVTLISIGDPALNKIKRQIQDERLRLESKGKTFKSNDIEENSLNLTFGAVKGWEWYGEVEFNGEKPEFNRKNVLAVFKELPWFKDQIDVEVSDESSFFTI